MIRSLSLVALLFSAAMVSACGDNIEFGRDASPLFDGASADAASSSDAAADDASGVRFDVTLTMSFGPFLDGDIMYADLRADSADTVSLGTDSGTIADGVDLVLTIPNVLEPGVDYTLYYWADRNADMICDDPLAAGNDRGWSQEFAAAADDVDLTASTLDPRDTDCAPE